MHLLRTGRTKVSYAETIPTSTYVVPVGGDLHSTERAR